MARRCLKYDTIHDDYGDTESSEDEIEDRPIRADKEPYGTLGEDSTLLIYIRHAESWSNRVSAMSPEQRTKEFGDGPDGLEKMRIIVSNARLTEKGEQQAREKSVRLVEKVKEHGFDKVDAIFVSAFDRTLQTALHISKDLRENGMVKEIHCVDELREGMHHARKPKSQLMKEFPFVTNWERLPEDDPAVPLYKDHKWIAAAKNKATKDDADEINNLPYAEPEAHFRHRQRFFFEYLMEKVQEKGLKCVIVVSHSKYGGALFGRVRTVKTGGKESRALKPTLDLVVPELQDKLKNVSMRAAYLTSGESKRVVAWHQDKKYISIWLPSCFAGCIPKGWLRTDQ